MIWNFNQREPVFLQISSIIKREILSGKFPPGSQIPSVRQLAFEASVNPNTIQHALSILESEGLIYARNTLGRFVTEDVEILNRLGTEIKRSTLEGLLSNAAQAGISYEEIIEYVKEKMNG